MKRVILAILLISSLFVLAACSFNIGSSDPTDSNNQVDPLVPANPEVPNDPVDPENPDDPVDPENPDDPTDPENPDDPVDPENPDDPVDPENPDDPVDPENPDDPVDPENPDDPEDPVVLPNTIDFSLVGYGVGTTGGHQANAHKVYASTGSTIIEALAAKKQATKDGQDYPLIIYIDGTITEANTGADEIEIKELANVSIIGVADSGIINGIGIRVNKSTNVIIQNLTIHHVLKDAGEGDAIHLVSSTYVWVDHNEMYNEFVWDPNASDSVKDEYDALLDIKKDCDYITVSYNYLHDAWKTGLIGYTASDNPTDRRITFHHNYYLNLSSRLPLIRGGQTHIYNNYYENVYSSAINCRVGALVNVVNCAFNNVKNPIACLYDDNGVGYWNMSGNIYTNCTGSSTASYEIPWSENMENTCDYSPSYSYTLHDAALVSAIVKKYAGVNIWTIDEESIISTSSVQTVKDLIDAIGEIANIEYTSYYYNLINQATVAYNALSQSEKAEITNAQILNSAWEKYYGEAVSSLVSQIADLDVTAENVLNALDDIYQLAVTYQNLTAEQKDLITNYATLASSLDLAKAAVKDALDNQTLAVIVNLSFDNDIIAFYQQYLEADLQATFIVVWPIVVNMVAINEEYSSQNKELMAQTIALFEALSAENLAYLTNYQAEIQEMKQAYQQLLSAKQTFDASLEATASISSDKTSSDGMFTLGNGGSIKAGSALIGEVNYTKYYDTVGGGDSTKRFIAFTVTGPVTVTVHASANQARELVLASVSTEISRQTVNEAAVYTYTISAAGTYYLYSGGSGIRIYGIIIE